MTQLRKLSVVSALFLGVMLAAGCGDDSADEPSNSDGGTAGKGGSGGSAGAPEGHGGDDGQTGEGGAPATSAWEGTTLHLTSEGSIQGGAVELSVTGDDAADIEVLYCERNYIVPDLEDTSAWAEDGYLEKVELKYNIPDFDGVPAELEIGFYYFDYSKAPKNPLSVGTAEEGTLGVEDVNVEIQLTLDDGNETEIADVAKSGKFYLEEYTGELGEDGLTIPDESGTFGGYLEATLESGSVLELSFTANCGENDLEIPE
jgi:hypothetical protein